MGQRVQAIVYGIFLTPKQWEALHDDDGEWKSMFPRGAGRVEDDVDNDEPCLGIAYAVQHVAEDDEIDFPCGRLEDILKMRVPELIKARWAVLAEWAKEFDVDLGRPYWLLVEIERA